MSALTPFILLIVAVFFVVNGIDNLVRTEKIVEKLAQKKKNNTPKKEISKNKMLLKLRINGSVLLVLGIFQLISLKMDIGIIKNPEVRLVNGNQEYFSAYEEVIEKFLKKNKTPSLVVGIVNGEEKALFTYGYEQLDESRVVNQETIFEIGSISKIFTGIILADTLASGEITLDQTVDRFIDSSEIGTQTVFDSVTLKALTTHTSGLPRLPESFSNMVNAYFAGITGSNPYQSVTRESVYQFMKDTKKISNQGDWKYSNYGVGVLGLCLSEHHQMTYNEMLTHIITEPLGMTNTSSLFLEDKASLYAEGYRGYADIGHLNFGIKSAPWLIAEGIVAAGGVRSTGEDMLVFLDALVHQALPSMTLSMQPLLQVDDTLWMGMNWIIEGKDKEDETLIWHNGQTGGFNSYLGLYEDKDVGVFVLTNSLVSVEALAHELLELTQE